MSFDLYATVTARIVSALEDAQKWQRPWTSAFAPSGDGALVRPVNAISKRSYQGINVPLLWSARRNSHHWATYKQWQSIGAQVRKGERASLIVFWKRVETVSGETENDSEGDHEFRPHWIARAYSVFNAEQVDGFGEAPTPPAPTFDPVTQAEEFVAKSGAVIRHGGDKAFYSSLDFIQMPHRGQFVGSATSTSAEAYYGTMLHELTHWSGHSSRCNRQLGNRFGSEAYAAEELIAELGAAFLCADLLLHHEPRADHACYIANWLSVLKNDKRAVFTAASKAEQAVRFLSGLQVPSVATAA
jgi:antirestriction protein ArdC